MTGSAKLLPLTHKQRQRFAIATGCVTFVWVIGVVQFVGSDPTRSVAANLVFGLVTAAPALVILIISYFATRARNSKG